MSGSYDQAPRRAPPQGSHNAGFDYDPVTASPRTAAGGSLDPYRNDYDASANPPRGTRRMSDHGRKMKAMRPVVEADSVTGKSLTLVIVIMCFLASLTAGAVWLIKTSSDAWMRDISSEVTVQIEPQKNRNIDRTITDVIGYLVAQPGILSARPISLETSTEMLEPWLGSSDVLKSLPVPRLIAIEIDRDSPANLDTVRAGLQREFLGVSLDDHRRWQAQIRAVTRSFALGGIAILVLVAAATMAIIVSATKSAMAANREIVEVLHFVGATDKFIAHEFEKHFLRLGIKAGIVGAFSAALVFVGMPFILQILGGGGLSQVELQRLIGSGVLNTTGYAVLAFVVVAVAGLCMITSRIGVKRILQGRH